MRFPFLSIATPNSAPMFAAYPKDPTPTSRVMPREIAGFRFLSIPHLLANMVTRL